MPHLIGVKPGLKGPPSSRNQGKVRVAGYFPQILFAIACRDAYHRQIAVLAQYADQLLWTLPR
jgi:ABC-type uncharacterized transport system ATPase subunit